MLNLDWGNIVSTLAAAWAGSWFAFRYNSGQEKLKKEIAEKNAANLALLRLARQCNVLALYKRDTLNPHRASEFRHVNINAFVPGLHVSDRIDQDSLVFLIERGRVDLLSTILLEDDRFETIMQNIHKRAEHHVAHVQPAIEKIGTPIVRSADVAAALGSRHDATMKNYTDNIYDQIDKSLTTLPECIRQFRDAMKGFYPGEKFTNVSIPAELTTN